MNKKNFFISDHNNQLQIKICDYHALSRFLVLIKIFLTNNYLCLSFKVCFDKRLHNQWIFFFDMILIWKFFAKVFIFFYQFNFHNFWANFKMKYLFWYTHILLQYLQKRLICSSFVQCSNKNISSSKMTIFIRNKINHKPHVHKSRVYTY